MKTLRFWCLSSGLVLALSVATFVTAQEKKAEPAKATEKKAAVTETAKKPGNRLPQNFAKLGLSDDQKTKIYAVQNTYNPQIDALEEQIKALKAKQTSEIEAVLTTEQSQQLADIRAAAKKKADDKKAADKPKVEVKTTAVEPAKKADEPVKKVETIKK